MSPGIALLERCRKVGVKLNTESLEMGLDVITFMGHRITKDGIRDINTPDTVESLDRFLVW